MLKSITIAFIITFASVAAFAQKVPDKPLDKWGKEESSKIVTESAWAKSYQSTTGSATAERSQVAREQRQNANSGGSDPRSVSRDFGPPPVTFRLHSGLPLRQAIVRLQQYEAGYDKMSAEDKARFDQGRKGFLVCVICKDYYVITITKTADAGRNTIEEGIFQSMTFDDLKGNVKLVNDKGEEREIAQFNAPKTSRDMTVLYFKRTDSAGKALITPETGSFKLVFKAEWLDIGNRFAPLLPRQIEFSVKKLVSGTEVLF